MKAEVIPFPRRTPSPIDIRAGDYVRVLNECRVVKVESVLILHGIVCVYQGGGVVEYGMEEVCAER